jgi:N-acetylmuramic acid 6-phosphate etherase
VNECLDKRYALRYDKKQEVSLTGIFSGKGRGGGDGFAGGKAGGGEALTASGAPRTLAGDVLGGFGRAVQAVEGVAADLAAAAERVAALFEAGGRLVYVGAGASGLIAAQDAAELPGTFGLDPHRIVKLIAGGAERPFDIVAAAEDDAEAGGAEMRALLPLRGSAVVAVSASGSTPYTVAAAREARAAGAFVIAVACRAGSPLLGLGSASLLLETGEEALRGSTRLAAGAAQKCALGLFSTLVGEALGHVHAGRMINLRAENDKLRKRALCIVVEITGASEREARRALTMADGDVKRAILIARGAAGADEAAQRLVASRGRIGPALNALAGTGAHRF